MSKTYEFSSYSHDRDCDDKQYDANPRIRIRSCMLKVFLLVLVFFGSRLMNLASIIISRWVC